MCYFGVLPVLLLWLFCVGYGLIALGWLLVGGRLWTVDCCGLLVLYCDLDVNSVVIARIWFMYVVCGDCVDVWLSGLCCLMVLF